jgi:sulfatase modifying factor 1
MKLIVLFGTLINMFLVWASPAFSKEILAEKIPDIKEALVPSGHYYAGFVFGKQDYKSHANIEVASYYIMKTEVTYKLYSVVVKWGKEHGYVLEQPCDECFDGAGDSEKPVYAITWVGAVVWANALSEMVGMTPFYQNAVGKPIKSIALRSEIDVARKPRNPTGYRLPDLAEWQIAARGAKKALDAGTYGYHHSGSDRIDDVAWHTGKSQSTGPTTVGRLKPNQIGLYDMSGNVSEWTGTPATDLDSAGAADGGKPMRGYYYYCGESWANNEASDLAFCDFHSAGFQEGDIGFRLVRSKAEK